jgi:peptidyl-tRNA hydrolase, PTH1 family
VSDEPSDDPLPIRLVVGLGNPGSKYAKSRHNAGQMVVEQVAARLGASRFTGRYAGQVADVRGPSGPVTFLVPTTFMNLSGESVGPAAGALHATPEQVLVVHDELDLPFGAVRGKSGGGHGGHNGLRSVTPALGSGAYPRVRLGVGRPTPEWRGDQADWVLAGFSEPADEVAAMISRGVEMVEAVIAEGIDAAIARFHAAEPGSKARERQARREDAEPDAPKPEDADGQ